MTTESAPGPAEFARHALEAMEASEGRRKRRHRDTTPDRIGLDLKRKILEDVITHQPSRGELEDHLFALVNASDDPGATRAMCVDVLDEYRAAASSPGFRGWLERGAPSDDRAS